MIFEAIPPQPPLPSLSLTPLKEIFCLPVSAPRGLSLVLGLGINFNALEKPLEQTDNFARISANTLSPCGKTRKLGLSHVCAIVLDNCCRILPRCLAQLYGPFLSWLTPRDWLIGRRWFCWKSAPLSLPSKPEEIAKKGIWRSGSRGLFIRVDGHTSRKYLDIVTVLLRGIRLKQMEACHHQSDRSISPSSSISRSLAQLSSEVLLLR